MPGENDLVSEHVQLKVKRLHPAAKLPTRAHATDAGLDFYATDQVVSPVGWVAIVGTGVAVEIPPGWCLYLTGRSGLASRGVTIAPGTIDAGYRGEIKVVMLWTADSEVWIKPGDKIAQGLLLPVPTCEVIEADELTPSDRGANGFGSTGA
jgi:dUTP pyrophosphatase